MRSLSVYTRGQLRAFRRQNTLCRARSATGVLPPFELERYLAAREFSCKYPLCCSDCEPLTMTELLQMSSEDQEAVEMWDHLALSYTEPQGHPKLRTGVTALYEGVSADDVLTAAPEELIYLAMTALLGPGDTLVVTFPGYQALYEVARGRDCKIKTWMPRKDDNGRWYFDIADLEALMNASVSMVAINFPHNPTGDQLSQQDLERVLQLAADQGAWLFADEMYRGLELASTARMPSAVDVASKVGLQSRVIVLSGLSKTYSCPGLRTGWLVCKDHEVLRLIEGLKDYTTICGCAPGEILSLMVLRNHERIAAGNRELIRTNVAAADKFFELYDDVFEWHAPSAGSIAFPRLRQCGEGIDIWTENVLHQAGVMLLPATVYDHEQSVKQHHFRLGLGRRNFKACLDKLGDYLDAQTKTPKTSPAAGSV